LDFDETFAPIARLEAIHILLAYATSHNIKLYQMDVKSAVLNGKMKHLPPLQDLKLFIYYLLMPPLTISNYIK
jgi:hypothetical protein